MLGAGDVTASPGDIWELTTDNKNEVHLLVLLVVDQHPTVTNHWLTLVLLDTLYPEDTGKLTPWSIHEIGWSYQQNNTRFWKKL